MAVSSSSVYSTVSFLFLDSPDVIVDRWQVVHKLHKGCEPYIVAWVAIDIVVESDIFDRVVLYSNCIVHNKRGLECNE